MTEPSRYKLTQADIDRCHQLVDELVGLHKVTDPEHGEQSQQGKKENALKALNKVGLLSAMLTEWAENQIFGIYYHVSKSEDQWLDAESCNRHDNELMWYKQDLPEDFWTTEEDVKNERAAIADILHNTFGRYGRGGWRMSLKNSLYALNEGQVDELLQPSDTRQQGNAYDIQELKWAAVKHVYRLMGEGWKKTAAQTKVGEFCGTTMDALKKWEIELIKNKRGDAATLRWMTLGSMMFHQASPEQILKKGLVEQEVKDNFKGFRDDNTESFQDDLVNAALNWNLNSPDNQTQELSFGILSAQKLPEDYPLDAMKERLKAAGMRGIS